jgi:two-component system, NarL family, nitrate/nitrite response regulator NarL
MDEGGHTSTEGTGPTTVFVVANVLLYREGMREILGRHSQIDVVGVAATVGDDVESLAALQPHLVLVDEPAAKAAETVAAVRRAAPEARVVVVAVNDDDHDVIAWAEAGVSGYITRDESLDTLVAVIRAVGRDELLCSPRLAATLLRQVARSARRAPSGRVDQRLTAREREVLALVEHGLSNKQIAHRLSIALPTVKNHVHNILAKLDARGRCEAIATLHGLQQVPG